jgi:Tfp pilus assembly protein PilF
VDSVAWVAERKNVLSTFFWMFTVLTYVYYTERPCLRRYLLTFFTFALGLMAKPMLVTLPFVLLLLDYWPLGRLQLGQLGRHSNKNADIFTGFYKQRFVASRLIIEKVPFLVLSAVLIYVASVSLKRVGVVITTDIVPMKLRIANALVSYVSYIEKIVWPQNLAVFYPFPNMVPMWQIIGSGLLLAGVSFVAVRKRRGMPYLVVGWLWYLGTLVPVIGLIQAGLWPAMADRWAYVPFIGLFVMIAWGIPELVTRWRFVKVGLGIGAGAFLSTLMGITWVQMGYWANSVTLFERALAVTSGNYAAHYNLGVSLFSQSKIDEATGHFREALRINPSFLDARTNLGVALVNQGRIAEAVQHLNEALQINSRSQTAHNNLGVALAQEGRIDDALQHFNEALQINPDFDDAHNNLGVVLASQEKFDEAIEHYSKALRINPGFARVHNNLGSALIRKGQLEEAIVHFREALRIRPGYASAKINLEKALASRDRMDSGFEKNQKKRTSEKDEIDNQ